ncbi:MAG TPA: ABC transporter permease [Terriglobia bacterium]|nr:ABC transporter permease [Terriglobia bacterium]
MTKRILSLFRNLFRKGAVEQSLDDELGSSLEVLIEEKVKQGLSQQVARREALIELGGVEQVKEEVRAVRAGRVLDDVCKDIRFAFRTLAKSPGFTIIVVLTLALGIGANTAIFSLINAVMLNLLPVRNPHRLVLLDWTGDMALIEGRRSPNAAPLSYPTFEDIRAHNQVFSSLFGFVPLGKPSMVIEGEASLAEGELVTGDYFSGLGVGPVLGRVITDADEKPGAPRVAVISYGYWSRRFGRNPKAVGKGATINGVPFTIVGVAPPEFFGVQPGRSVDVWVPLAEGSRLLPYGLSSGPGGRDPFTSSDWWWLMMMGRLKPGVSTQRGTAQADLLFRQSISNFLKTHPATVPPHIRLDPASRGLANLRQEFSRPLWILIILVSVVLLIACANVAALLVARSNTRHREIAIRLALGSSGGRLVRQLLSESVLLAGWGGALGLLFAYWGSHALLALMSGGGEPLTLTVQLDAKVLAFTAVVSMVTGILFGLAPAWRSTRVELTPTLKATASGTSVVSQRTRLGFGNSLVIAQVALSLPLLVGAGLFVRTLENLENENLGFNPHHLLLFGVDPSQAGYKGEQRIDFYGRLLQRLQALPGVKSATMSQTTLISGLRDGWTVSIEGLKPKPGQNRDVDLNFVGPSFFKAMEIPLLVGRGIGWQDTASSPQVVVVNKGFARPFLDGRNPVGYTITVKNFVGKGPPSFSYRIVGMVQDAKYASLREASRPTVYAAYSQMPAYFGELHYELRTVGNPLALVPTVRRAVRELDPNLPLAGVKTQTEQIAETVVQERVFARLSSFFAALAGILACIGLYGLMAYALARRTGEIGIRMALGAQKSDVLRMIIGQGLRLALIGVAIGIAGALGLTRFLSSLLYGVKPTDPVTFIAVSLALIAVSLLACYIPARRAMKVDPIVALRYE